MQNNDSNTGVSNVHVPLNPAAVGTVGTVNFNHTLVPDSVVYSDSVLETTPSVEQKQLGNIRMLGQHQDTDLPQDQMEEATQVEPAYSNVISVEINVTLNTGLTFLKGSTKELKSLNLANKKTGVVEKYNYYNPFMRMDKDKHNGEGILRKSFATITSNIHSVFGKQLVFLATDGFVSMSAEETTKALTAQVQTLLKSLRNEFPQSPEEALFETTIVLHDGTEFTRPVSFGELFAISGWVVSELDATSCVTTHTTVFNIGLNIGALYDSHEPHVFVGRASDFVEKQLKSVGLLDIVNYNINYSIDSTTLESSDVRDTLEILIAENGYSVVSKLGVLSGNYPWVDASSADDLFGVGCDLILRSPNEALVEAE